MPTPADFITEPYPNLVANLNAAIEALQRLRSQPGGERWQRALDAAERLRADVAALAESATA
jgi:hypothetical protein